LVYQVISNRAEAPKGDYDTFYQGGVNGVIVNDGTLGELVESVKRVFDL
jgi:hypothetical protein